MKEIFIVVFVFFNAIAFYAQQFDDLVFNQDLNVLVTEKTEVAPTVFEVNNEKFTEEIKTKSKRITQEYKDALSEIALAEKDSVNAYEKSRVYIEKNTKIEQLKNYISEFLSANTPYENKKDKLLNAQIISDEYNLGYSIYADSNINTSFKTKFFVLSKNKIDLKVHLKKILWGMDSLVLESFDNEIANNKLKKAREKFETIKKHEIISGKSKFKTHKVLTLGADVVNAEEKVSGNFSNMGEYYVVNADVKGFYGEQLISVKEAQSKKLKDEDFVFSISAVLIKHSETGTTYLVAPGFIDQYALNKLAIRDKFKGKTAFPEKIYRNQKEKKYDYLILDYNKSQITSMGE